MESVFQNVFELESEERVNQTPQRTHSGGFGKFEPINQFVSLEWWNYTYLVHLSCEVSLTVSKIQMVSATNGTHSKEL